MTPASARGLDQAFRVAAAELGMCSAAWLFAREVSGEPEGVRVLREELGRDYPVLDAVCALWLEGRRAPELHLDGVLAACAGASRVVVAGLEATFLDALVALLTVPIFLVKHSTLEPSWERVLANYGDRVAATDLENFQRHAGRRSVLVSFAYGTRDDRTHVKPSTLRVLGPDVRTQFRSVVAWDVLRSPMYVYPRWLVEVPAAEFSELV